MILMGWEWLCKARSRERVKVFMPSLPQIHLYFALFSLSLSNNFKGLDRSTNNLGQLTQVRRYKCLLFHLIERHLSSVCLPQQRIYIILYSSLVRKKSKKKLRSIFSICFFPEKKIKLGEKMNFFFEVALFFREKAQQFPCNKNQPQILLFDSLQLAPSCNCAKKTQKIWTVVKELLSFWSNLLNWAKEGRNPLAKLLKPLLRVYQDGLDCFQRKSTRLLGMVAHKVKKYIFRWRGKRERELDWSVFLAIHQSYRSLLCTVRITHYKKRLLSKCNTLLLIQAGLPDQWT